MAMIDDQIKRAAAAEPPTSDDAPDTAGHGAVRAGRRLWLALLACGVAVLVIAVTGCGSSKPAYCSDRTNLQNSVKGLKSVDLKGGLSGVRSQLTKIQSDATALVGSAKNDFPSQTSAIKTSVQTLTGAVKTLSTTPSVAQIAKIAADVSAVSSSVTAFADATSSKCS
jgi:hypothetical protein